MNAKVRPSEKKNNEFREILKSEGTGLFQNLMKAGLEKLMQEALEEEVTDYLGRDWYERNAEEKELKGYRNGYKDAKIKTSEGILKLFAPRVRNTEEKFESMILQRIEEVEENVKRLSIQMYVKGLSTRDIEDTFTDSKGEKLLSRSGVSRLNQSLYEEYLKFTQRNLSAYDLVYLFVDGVYEGIRRYTNNQALLCAWGIMSDGTKQLLGLMTVESESQAAWEMFFEDMISRGLRQPLLVTADGAKGARQAITNSFPKAYRQRCLVHKLRNLLSKLPKDKQEEVLVYLKKVFYALSYEDAKLQAAEFVNRYSNVHPSMVKCFCEDLEACLIHLKFPEEHRRYIRSTNLIERSFEEQKRRTKVMPQHENEKGMLGLVFSVLWETSLKWRRVQMDYYQLSLLKNIRYLICPQLSQSDLISYERVA
jgi:putative transposase